jgi:hypothetical protein
LIGYRENNHLRAFSNFSSSSTILNGFSENYSVFKYFYTIKKFYLFFHYFYKKEVENTAECLNKERCLESLAELRHAKWFQVVIN